MASSFLSQISIIVYLISRLKPASILDIGKGFGKYGFLIHEYVGIGDKKPINPALSMKDQSKVKIDAVEADHNLLMTHLEYFYDKIYSANILEIYRKLDRYDLVLMIDVIEHLDKNSTLEMIKYFISQNYVLIIASPKLFFDQELYCSPYERHVSFWSPKDFKSLCNVDYQKVDAGVIYLLSQEKLDIRGFGRGFIKKIRRLARAFINEF